MLTPYPPTSFYHGLVSASFFLHRKRNGSAFHKCCSFFRKTDAQVVFRAACGKRADPPGRKDSRMLSPRQVKRAAGDFQKQHGA
jgi:hypothetical protein